MAPAFGLRQPAAALAGAQPAARGEFLADCESSSRSRPARSRLRGEERQQAAAVQSLAALSCRSEVARQRSIAVPRPAPDKSRIAQDVRFAMFRALACGNRNDRKNAGTAVGGSPSL